MKTSLGAREDVPAARHHTRIVITHFCVITILTQCRAVQCSASTSSHRTRQTIHIARFAVLRRADLLCQRPNRRAALSSGSTASLHLQPYSVHITCAALPEAHGSVGAAPAMPRRPAAAVPARPCSSILRLRACLRRVFVGKLFTAYVPHLPAAAQSITHN